jgi:hypothetical protein
MYHTKTSNQGSLPHHGISTKGHGRVSLAVIPTAGYKVFRPDVRIFLIGWNSLRDHGP